MAMPISSVLKTTPRIPLVASEIHKPFDLASRIAELTSVSVESENNTLQSQRIVDGEFIVDLLFGNGERSFSLVGGDYFAMQHSGESSYTISSYDTTVPPKTIVLLAGQATFFPVSHAEVRVTERSASDVVLLVSCSMPIPMPVPVPSV